MNWYDISKFLHVGFAIVWLGGALIMVILGAAAERARDDQDLVLIVRKVAWSADRVYVPASILMLIFGVTTTWIGGLWGHLFVVLGLAGIVATIALGVLVLSPRAKKVQAGYASGGPNASVVATSREILTIAKFDMVLLFTIVADMVLKPQLGDWVELLVMALVILVAATLFLLPLRNSAPAATA